MSFGVRVRHVPQTAWCTASGYGNYLNVPTATSIPLSVAALDDHIVMDFTEKASPLMPSAEQQEKFNAWLAAYKRNEKCDIDVYGKPTEKQLQDLERVRSISKELQDNIQELEKRVVTEDEVAAMTAPAEDVHFTDQHEFMSGEAVNESDQVADFMSAKEEEKQRLTSGKAAKSEIQNFYKDQCVFLTGGTGFLGKVCTSTYFCLYVTESLNVKNTNFEMTNRTKSFYGNQKPLAIAWDSALNLNTGRTSGDGVSSPRPAYTQRQGLVADNFAIRHKDGRVKCEAVSAARSTARALKIIIIGRAEKTAKCDIDCDTTVLRVQTKSEKLSKCEPQP
ncbi:hypothetical protein EVAR_99186_1 [Eumeta japonica]|uniref:Uncharacterized protein n=1 Tax=Eumeta variegata TaxID=151549 RepID=A0A4C1YTD5_EUMVA|nr:hypothetical protein EVAR_99186_1 [Eumeta japonica]